MSREILEAMHALAREKGIEPEKLMMALEDALLSAYKKQPGSAKYARVEMDRDTADFRVIELIIPERLEAHLIVETIDEETTIDPETGEMREPEEPEIDPGKFKEYRDQIEERDVTPDDFGRIAAQTAKQVILQRIREAERDMMYEEYRDRVGELITGIVQQSDSRYTLVQLRERVEALLPKSEQVEGERYDHSQRIKAVIKEVSPSTKGPAVIVPDDQLSLAIGREGQNARLAARLTGWRVDIRSETEFAAEEAEHGYEEEEVHGRCAAILSNGRRCPNAALPGSRYCGLETHQALAAIDSDKIVDLQAQEAAAEAPPEPTAAAAAPGEEETAQAAQPEPEAAQESAATEVAQPEAEEARESPPGAEESDAPTGQPPAEAQASESAEPAVAEQPTEPAEGSLEPAAPVPGQQQASAQGSPAAAEEQAQ